MPSPRSSIPLLLLLLLATGCPKPERDTVTQVIGSEGGTLIHPAGAVLRVPAGALTSPVELSVGSEQAPNSGTLGATPLGKAFLLGPEGQTFQKPVELELPFDPALVPSGTDPGALRVYIAPGRSTDYVALETTAGASANKLLAQTLHFSSVVPGAPTNPNPLFVTTQFLPSGEVGTAYGPSPLSATGGTPAFAWSVGSGSLPPGISVTPAGQLQGTPTAPGSYAFAIRVSDSGGQTVEKPLTLDVVPAGGNPLPRVFSVAPTAISAGSGDTQVVLTGLDFVSGCYAFIGGTGLSTLFESSGQVQAVIPASLLASPGTLQIGVFNPAPGGGASNTVTITVGSATSLSVTSVAPSQALVNSGPQVITVTGTGFAPGSAVTLDGTTLATTYGGPTQLTATIPTSMLTTVGQRAVRVSNQLIGGGLSNTVPFTVVNQAPAITAMSPPEAPAGYGANLQLMLTRTTFAPGGQAYLGALPLPTQVNGTTEALITVDKNYLVNPGTFQLTFINPAPGGGTSAPFPFPIVTLPAPAELVSAPGTYPMHLAVDDVSVYWSELYNNKVNKVPINGGPVTTLADDTRAYRPSGLAVAHCNVYWGNVGRPTSASQYALGSVMAVPVNGGDPGQATTFQGNYPNLVRYDRWTGDLYWTTGPDVGDTIHRAPALGGPSILTGYVGWNQAFELDATYLYSLSRGSGSSGFWDGGVLRMAKDGSGAVWLSTYQHEPRGLAVGGGRVYWSVQEGEIRSVAISGTGGVSTVHKYQSGVTSLAIDATNLYWTTGNDVRMAPLAGGPVRILAHALNSGARDLAVDGANLYWLTDTGKVMQLARPGGSGGPPAIGACAGSPGWPFPVRLSEFGGYGRLVTDGSFVYWTDGHGSGSGSVYKVPVTGAATPTTLASSQYLPQSLQLHAGRLYWVNYSNATYGNITSINTSGTPAASVYASGQPNVDSLAVDGSGVWWTSSVNWKVWRNSQLVKDHYPDIPNAIALDATNAYWIAGGYTWTMPKSGGTPTQVMAGGGEMVAQGGFLYWINGWPSQSIVRRDLATGTQVTLVTGQTQMRNLVVDGSDLYWLSDGIEPKENGRVKRLRGGDTTPVVLAEGQPQPLGLAVDAQNVYWLNAGTAPAIPPLPGSVMKLPKNARP